MAFLWSSRCDTFEGSDNSIRQLLSPEAQTSLCDKRLHLKVASMQASMYLHDHILIIAGASSGCWFVSKVRKLGAKWEQNGSNAKTRITATYVAAPV